MLGKLWKISSVERIASQYALFGFIKHLRKQSAFVVAVGDYDGFWWN